MFGRRNRHRRRFGRKARVNHTPRTVADMVPREQASVLALAPAARSDLHKLMALGVLPGAPLTLLARSPSFVLQVGETVLALDEKMARSIVVGPPIEG
ncbi:MAG: ferrous iron transport protein [Bacillota bacterium]|nr:ferrous iron transport protein [Bacillota bacterium]MDK2856265.1 ferrous iron transport protein [Bacillota bacterium]MDK2924989.1 ferrous iron transport protein [Bacillota bacterium]